jgi:SAM-dependent methyltransferase
MAEKSMDNGRFADVTEMAGQKVSSEQLLRTCHRYYWAKDYVAGKEIAEVACGAGPGLGYLAQTAANVRAGDISKEVLDCARAVYAGAIELAEFDASATPYASGSLDALLLYEALYYLPDADAFMTEAARVLRPGGALLIATANKDLFDFTPSAYSTEYFGVAELAALCARHRFDARFFGYLDVQKVSMRQRLLRPLKLVATRLGMVPKTMGGKQWLKRVFFGEMVDMPSSIIETPQPYEEPVELSQSEADRRHKVIYCAAKKVDRGQK